MTVKTDAISLSSLRHILNFSLPLQSVRQAQMASTLSADRRALSVTKSRDQQKNVMF